MNPILFAIVVALGVICGIPALFALLGMLIEVVRAILAHFWLLLLAAGVVTFIFALFGRMLNMI